VKRRFARYTVLRKYTLQQENHFGESGGGAAGIADPFSRKR
jgi:hypothetical protein